MENETLGVEVVEVAEQPIASDTSVETQEVAEPVASEESQEVTPPAKDDRDSWFAEKRRELEAKEKEMAKEYEAKLEAERQRIAELETKTKDFEKKEKYEGLRKQAEEYGLDYDELVAEVERQEALEAEKAKTVEELQREKTEKEQLAEKNKELERDLLIAKMSMEDRDELLSFDPTINLKELTEDFYKLRANGYSPLKAYKLSQALKDEVVVAETPGKVNSVPVDAETISEDSWNSMTKAEQEKLMSTNFEKVYKSQMTWLKKK